jgi:hypothetical protein
MRYRDAKKLHNEDEVIFKATGESLKVLSIKPIHPDNKAIRLIDIEVSGPKWGYRWVTHLEVR